MSVNSTPSKQRGASAFSSLFALWDPPACGQEEGRGTEDFHKSFSSLLRLLNFTSSCYFISQERPRLGMCLDGVLSEVSLFLERNRFVQVSLRPVHSFSSEDAEEWIAAYLRYLRACKPFQEEGYREQIISRLRIFPVICLEGGAALFKAGPFLSFLRESFFLPSVLVPRRAVEEIAARLSRDAEPPWVRVYVTEGSPFDPHASLEVLYAHEIFDRMLESPSAGLTEGMPSSCEESLMLDSAGGLRSCLTGQAEAARCMNCLIPLMAPVGASYRVNPHGAAAWHELCDRTASRFVREGEHARALQVWNSSAEAYPPEAVPSSLLLNLALCHYEAGERNKTMELLQTAGKADPSSPDIRYYMGRCEFDWKDYIEAADRFREAVELALPHPLRGLAQYYRGLAHYHLEEYEEALEALEESEREGMEGSPPPFYQGLCLLGKKEPRKALGRFQEALARGPSSEDLFHVLFYLAHTHKEMDEFESALDYCSRAEQLEPESYEIWNLKGFCLFRQRRYDDAIACFQKAIRINPASAIDYANIGSNLRDKGDKEGAAAMYKKALSLDPTIEFAREALRRLKDRDARQS
jgi:tetratricopeptide (TPR) repeat protein